VEKLGRASNIRSTSLTGESSASTKKRYDAPPPNRPGRTLLREPGPAGPTPGKTRCEATVNETRAQKEAILELLAQGRVEPASCRQTKSTFGMPRRTSLNRLSMYRDPRPRGRREADEAALRSTTKDEQDVFLAFPTTTPHTRDNRSSWASKAEGHTGAQRRGKNGAGISESIRPPAGKCPTFIPLRRQPMPKLDGHAVLQSPLRRPGDEGPSRSIFYEREGPGARDVAPGMEHRGRGRLTFNGKGRSTGYELLRRRFGEPVF